MKLFQHLLAERRAGIEPMLDTPALEARRNHETLYGDKTRQAYHWRLAFFVMAIYALYNQVERSFLIHEKQYLPVVIAEHEDASMRFVGTPDPNWKPEDRHIITALKELVDTIRGRTLDAKADRKHWQRMVDRSTEHGQQQLGQAYEELSKLDTKGRIEVAHASLNKDSDGTFVLRWHEKRHDENNQLVAPILRFVGHFTVVVEVPRSLAVFARNETGIWYEGWNISEDKDLQ